MHLRTIAEVNGLDVSYFINAGERSETSCGSGIGRYRNATLLPRLFKAYFALPSHTCRLHALRMMEAMASRTNGVNGENAFQAKSLR
ncbi:hypothetical protein [Methylobacterium brachiatum]|uniref:hypothetical protein n=1 Tax=Methylobacterium brachiatum TaxID=269660 RepID=UPI00244C6E8B|nr:hypothetical protein [Methylobacterium brachiatum]MDH2310313.1 hypothetical protein [Methylobacterium brachiatum]